MEIDLKPNIAYVDEIEDERDNFFNDAYDSGLFGDIHLLAPEDDIQNMLNVINDLKIDALVTDFNLSENFPLAYNGENLVSAFLEARNDFPCFIRTSVDGWMQTISDDVNRVYSKNAKLDGGVGRHLYERILRQIQLYRNKVDGWQNELAELLQKDPTERTAEDVERLAHLDTKIEASLGKDQAIPEHLKKSLFDTENQLIEETERLIVHIKEKLGEK